MRKEFYIGTQEDMTDYMERAAAYLRSIKKGTLIGGGINLSDPSLYEPYFFGSINGGRNA